MARGWWMLGLGLIGCGAGLAASGGLQWAPPPRGPATVAPPAPAARQARAAPTPSEQAAAADFEALRVSYGDLTYPQLAKKLDLRRAPDAPPSFDPTGVDYYGKIRKALDLSADEQDVYRRAGVVGVDHGAHLTMASAYLEIYKADLPVLITTDSLLHAMHRSFDTVLLELERWHFLPDIRAALIHAHGALAAQAAAVGTPALQASARDVDLYLTVALDLLGQEKEKAEPILSIFNQEEAVASLRDAVAALKPVQRLPIYGGRRDVDFSQFKPRGHYTRDPALQRYFQALMWLGRVDLGFRLDGARERLDAALLGVLLSKSGQLETLANVDRAIKFFVGDSDNLGPAEMAAALARMGVRDVPDLAAAGVGDRLAAELRAAGAGKQRIRSEMLDSDPTNTVQTPLPEVLQMFGQRFIIDSFVTAKVVYDAIVFNNEKQTRTMPTGLDVMAALGNDEAVALLEPELTKWSYAANLLAARTFVERQPAQTWNASVYNIWLSALAKLDDVPAGSNFPEVMRGRAWQAKQLQTQLASWAELRHDTILYAKQSFTAVIACEYPAGYVEPYPEAFARLAVFAEQSGAWLTAAGLSTPGMGTFFGFFATTARKLEALARKELAGQPFDKGERTFVKDAISISWHGGGCGGPRKEYSGWYPQMIYGGPPEKWEPVVADVHTDPNSGNVLEVGVGDAGYVVVAVDNAGDRAAYVGPAYSYYELPSGERLTDEQWQERIRAKKLPPRPEWTRAFVPSPRP